MSETLPKFPRRFRGVFPTASQKYEHFSLESKPRHYEEWRSLMVAKLEKRKRKLIKHHDSFTACSACEKLEVIDEVLEALQD